MTVTTVTMGVLKMASSRKPVLTKKDYLNSILRSYVLQNAQNYGTMQGTGMANSIMPQLRKIYKDDDAEFKPVTTSNLEFYNTNPQPYPFVTSIMLAMYDSGQDENDVRAIKFALMGPLAGIGDALSQFGLAPLFSSIFASLALQGMTWAPISVHSVFVWYHFRSPDVDGLSGMESRYQHY